jgi:hypothetical protein
MAKEEPRSTEDLPHLSFENFLVGEDAAIDFARLNRNESLHVVLVDRHRGRTLP